MLFTLSISTVGCRPLPSSSILNDPAIRLISNVSIALVASPHYWSCHRRSVIHYVYDYNSTSDYYLFHFHYVDNFRSLASPLIRHFISKHHPFHCSLRSLNLFSHDFVIVNFSALFVNIRRTLKSIRCKMLFMVLLKISLKFHNASHPRSTLCLHSAVWLSRPNLACAQNTHSCLLSQ